MYISQFDDQHPDSGRLERERLINRGYKTYMLICCREKTCLARDYDIYIPRNPRLDPQDDTVGCDYWSAETSDQQLP